MKTRNAGAEKSLGRLLTMLGILFMTALSVRGHEITVAAAAKAEAGAQVSIAGFAFTPAEITIAAGESITWTNNDGAPHALEYQDGAPGTDLLLPDASFSRRFEQPGTYDYTCSIHPYMTGRVVVRPR